jgi:hypothetical protein
MAIHTSQIVPPFDFRSAEALPLPQRFHECLNRARALAAGSGYGRYFNAPCVPSTGASEAELQNMEFELGVQLPAEYRQFLVICRYLKLGDGCEIGGLDHDGLYVTEVPWVSSEHRPGVDYLVFASYWRYADGDQLMFDLTDPARPVVAYLHEHGPLFENYAPSFSLALWRLVHETAS